MASGRPDWFGTIVSAGKYNSTYIAIAVDASGNIVGLMKGDDDGTLRTIAVDGSGIMKANLSAQDLNFLTVRPAYGEAKYAAGTETVPNNTETSLVTVTDQGVTYGGVIYWDSGVTDSKIMYGRLYTDDVLSFTMQIDFMRLNGLTRPGSAPMYAARVDPTNMTYAIGISPGTTFESKLELRVVHAAGLSIDVSYQLIYAVTP